MAKIISVCNRLQAGDYENDNGGKRRVSRLAQFIHATLQFSLRLQCHALHWTDNGYSSIHKPTSLFCKCFKIDSVHRRDTLYDLCVIQCIFAEVDRSRRVSASVQLIVRPSSTRCTRSPATQRTPPVSTAESQMSACPSRPWPNIPA